MKNILLLGRLPFDMAEVRKSLGGLEVNVFTGTSIEEARAVLDQESIHHVIMGAGLDLALRLQVIQHVFTVSQATTVHMKDRASGRQGMMPFVRGVLEGLVT